MDVDVVCTLHIHSFVLVFILGNKIDLMPESRSGHLS